MQQPVGPKPPHRGAPRTRVTRPEPQPTRPPPARRPPSQPRPPHRPAPAPAPSQQQVVLKSQILAGGRGLGKFTSGLQGGVHICTAARAQELAKQMLGGTLVTKQTGPAGKPVNTLYVARKMKLKREMYFAILLDRKTAGPVMIGCRWGLAMRARGANRPRARPLPPQPDGRAPTLRAAAATPAQPPRPRAPATALPCNGAHYSLPGLPAKPRSEGGTSIEDLAEKFPEKIIKIPIDIRQGITDVQARAAPRRGGGRGGRAAFWTEPRW